MKLFGWGKKKEAAPPVRSVLEPLPAPSVPEKAELPPLMKQKKKPVKPRFPSLPAKKTPWKAAKRFEKKAFEKEKELLEQRETLKVLQPLFIPGAQYKSLVVDLIDAKSELKKAQFFVDKVENISDLKEQKFEALRKNIETVQRKLIFMDKTLFK